MQKYLIVEGKSNQKFEEQFYPMSSTKRSIPEDSTIEDIIFVQCCTNNSYLMIRYAHTIQVVNLQKGNNKNRKRSVFRLEKKPTLCCICMDMLILKIYKNLYIYNLRDKRQFMIMDVFEIVGAFQEESTKKTVLFGIVEGILQFYEIDEVKGISLRKNSQKIKILNQQQRQEMEQPTIYNEDRQCICILFKKRIVIINKGKMNTVHNYYLQNSINSYKVLILSEYIVVYEGNQMIVYKKQESEEICTLYTQQQIDSVTRYNSNNEILLMEKGKSVINKYNIRSIVSLGVVQSEEIYNQHTPSLANHNKLMHIQQNIYLFQFQDNNYKIYLIHQPICFQNIPVHHYNVNHTYTHSSFNFNFSKQSMQFEQKPQIKIQPYIDIYNDLNIKNYIQQCIPQIHHIYNTIPFNNSQPYFYWNVFLQMLQKIKTLEQIFKGTIQDKHANKYYWNLCFIFQQPHKMKNVIMETKTSSFIKKHHSIKQKWREIIWNFLNLYGFQIILKQFEIIKKLQEKEEKVNGLIDFLKKQSMYYYPPNKKSTFSETLAYVLWNQNQLKEGKGNSQCKQLYRTLRRDNQQDQLLQKLPENISIFDNKKLQNVYDNALRHCSIKMFIKDMKEGQFSGEQIFRIIQFLYEYFLENYDNMKNAQNIERKDVQVLFQYMVQVSQKLGDSSYIKAKLYREFHKYDRNYDPFLDKNRIRQILYKNKFRYEKQNWKKIEEYLEYFEN